MLEEVKNKIKNMLEEANKKADYCKGVEYDEGFYVGKSEALEEVLEMISIVEKL